MINAGTIPGATDTIPLIIQDKTFVPEDADVQHATTPDGTVKSYGQDPTWDSIRWGGYGRPVVSPRVHAGAEPRRPERHERLRALDVRSLVLAARHPAVWADRQPVLRSELQPRRPATWQYQTDPFCEPQQIPGTPNISVGMEQFNDTPLVNGVAYPTVTLEPKTYRLRILSAANDRFFNFQWYVADPTAPGHLSS